MIMRLLFWLAFAFLVLMALRSKWRAATRPGGSETAPAKRKTRVEGEVETMLCCAHCQVYYPASETVTVNGRDYCGAAHADAGLPRRETIT